LVEIACFSDKGMFVPAGTVNIVLAGSAAGVAGFEVDVGVGVAAGADVGAGVDVGVDCAAAIPASSRTPAIAARSVIEDLPF
jgi:hypothetical protein